MSTAAAPTTAGSSPTVLNEKPPTSPTPNKDDNNNTTANNNNNKTSSNSKAPSFLSKYLPEWFLVAIRTRRTWKTFVRCIVVFIVMMVLLVDGTTINVMGQAAFFGLIVSLMLPPNMAVAMFMFATAMLVVGMCLGWAVGCAAMAASLAARSSTLLASQYTNAESKLVAGVAPDAQFQAFVFQGQFLDPGASAVFGVFFFVGTFCFALIRAYIPRLALVAIFGTIVLDVMCTYGPLFPSSQYTLATLFLIPTGIYIGVALGGIILIFPQSMNHTWLTSLTDTVLTPALSVLEQQQRALSPDIQPSDSEAWAALRQETAAEGRKLITATQGLLGQTNMVDLEITRGRLGPGDLKGISEMLMPISSRSLGLMSFLLLVDERNKSEDAAAAAATGAATPGTPADPGTITPQSTQRFDALRSKIKAREETHGHDLDSLRPLLLDATNPLLSACRVALKGRLDWLAYANSTRWRGSKSTKEEESAYAEAKAQVQAVRDSLHELRTVHRLRVLKPFERFFEPETGELLQEIKDHVDDRMFAANSLFLCFVFGTTLRAYAESLLLFLDFTLELQRKRTRNRFWFPTGFGKLGRKILARRGQEGTGLEIGVPTALDEETTAVDQDSVDEEDGEMISEVKAKALDPDSTPARTWLGRLYTRVTAIFRWFMKPQAVYALRYSFLSIALFAFAVHPNTVYFNYANRGLWALIMSQQGLGVYAGEQIASFIIRTSGTVLGLLLGMVCWYIGAANGSGNPYGIVIITTVMIAPFLFVRISGPQAATVVWIMTGTMIIFVVGYSWVDSHIQTIQNAGVGVFLAWRRVLLVLIGFGCAFVVMVIPYPTSARQVVRKTLAATTEELVNVLALELDGCIQSSHDTEAHWATMRSKGIKQIGGRLLAISTQLQAILPSMTTAKLEPTFKGPWPAEVYARLLTTQWKIIQSVALLNAALSDLDAHWLHTLVHKTPFLNPNFLADISATTYLVARSLRHAAPVPATITPLRERLIYHDRHAAAFGGPGTIHSEILREELDASPSHVDGASIGLRTMTLSTLQDEQMVYHSTAIVGLASLIRTVDEIIDITRELCGTTQVYPGLDTMRSEYLGMEEAAIRHRIDKST